MRNLKRVLALALALVMMLGMMITASAATYSDQAAIDEDYAVAVEVLTGMGVFKGTGAGFAPKAILSRAEAAALIYRVISADVKDSKIDLYDYSSFDDVAEGAWYTGYVTYAANGGYIKGDGTGNFNPNDKVTGIQVLAIMLRAMGYGQKGEFEGAAWKDNVLTTADDLDILDNVNVKSLDIPASREIVAQLLFDAIQAPTTTYTPAFGYVDNWNLLTSNASLGWKNFGLTSDESSDEWGRPGIVWYNGNKGIAKGFYALIEEAPLATYTTSVTECQIATDIGLKTKAGFDMYTNGVVNKSAYEVQPLDTVQRIGGQGVLVEVYEDEIVVISTFLAEVINVTPVRYDAAGHKAADAAIYLRVYDADTNAQSTVTNMVLTSEENYTYAKGDMVLVNSYTNNTVNTTTGTVTVGTVATTGTAPMGDYAEILGLATAMVGAQTFHWYNAPKHTIDGTNYDDAAELHLDEAVYSTAKYTWYFDQYGNLIGSTDIAATYTYGIIENIQWINPVGAEGYAQATIRYMDGTTATEIVLKVDNVVTAYAQYTQPVGYDSTDNMFYVSTALENNEDICGKDLYRVEKKANGMLELTHVVDVKASNAKAHIATADINQFGTGANAVSAITNGTKTVYANANTVFMVQVAKNMGFKTVYTYEMVTGYQNMAKYTGTDVVVDYVYTNADSYVDLVYVTGTPDSAAPYYGLFFLDTTRGIQGVLNAQGTAVDYYVVSGILDGVAGTYKVAADALFKTTNAAITLADFNKIASELSYVQVTGDEFTEVWDTAADGHNLFQKLGTVKYKDLYLDIQGAGVPNSGVTTKNGDVLKVGTAYYNVAGLTPVVGEWADDMSGKTVYVIYDNTKVIAGASVAKAVYIVTPGTGITNSGAGTPNTTGNILREVKVYQGGTLIATKTYLQTGITAGTYTTGQDYATVSGVLTDLAVTGATVITDASSVVVAADQTTTVTYIVTVD